MKTCLRRRFKRPYDIIANTQFPRKEFYIHEVLNKIYLQNLFRIGANPTVGVLATLRIAVVRMRCDALEMACLILPRGMWHGLAAVRPSAPADEGLDGAGDKK